MQLVKKHRPLEIVSNIEPYDILQDLDAIQPSITMIEAVIGSVTKVSYNFNFFFNSL